MVTAIWVPANPDSGVEVVQCTDLDDLNRLVGGLIEAVDIEELGATVYVNEEGRVRRMPFNSRASFLWWYYIPWTEHAMLVGDVAIVGAPDEEGDDTDAPEDLIQLLTDDRPFAVRLRIDGDPLSFAASSSRIASVVLPLVEGDPSWVLSSVRYDDCWSAFAWATVLRDRWQDVSDTEVVPLSTLTEATADALRSTPHD